MLQTQVNYWNYVENRRHNKEMESQNLQSLETQRDQARSAARQASAAMTQAENSMITARASERTSYANLQNAATNARNAQTNAENAQINALNASTNRMNYQLAAEKQAFEITPGSPGYEMNLQKVEATTKQAEAAESQAASRRIEVLSSPEYTGTRNQLIREQTKTEQAKQGSLKADVPLKQAQTGVQKSQRVLNDVNIITSGYGLIKSVAKDIVSLVGAKNYSSSLKALWGQ